MILSIWGRFIPIPAAIASTAKVRPETGKRSTFRPEAALNGPISH